MHTCAGCGMEMGIASTSMLDYWILETGAIRERWNPRLSGPITFVCPVCDNYALGIETHDGLPFYSPHTSAFMTINDWDWNHSPYECDIREWPDFGCLTFSEESIRSAVVHLRKTRPEIVDIPAPYPVSDHLIGPTGIPEDEAPQLEWRTQLDVLHSRLGGSFSIPELDHVIRELVHALTCQELQSRD